MMPSTFRRRCLALLFCLLLLLGSGCAASDADPDASEPIDYSLQMNTTFPLSDSLPRGDGATAHVILLLGQSNASGCSITEYLQLNTTAEEFAVYQAGFDNVLINYCIDDHSFTSEGAFRRVDLTCGCGEGFFGPEVGMAQTLSEAYPDQTFYILKYTMSGYSLANHWLREGERGDIYHACLLFVRTYMEDLRANGYLPRLDAICWMQGESDTAQQNADRYYENQVAFASYLRADLAPYYEDDVYFIDAGISSSPYCEPGYPTVNLAKERFATLSPYNIYFSTIEAGLTTLYEPDYEPDLGHYDSLCEITLGKMFGERVLLAIFGEKN